MNPPANLARVALLYFPLVTCAVLVVVRKPDKRHAAAALLAFLWAFPALVGVEFLAQRFGWWTCAVPSGVLPAPPDVLAGWALLWGPVPVLGLWRRPVVVVVAALALDVWLMPQVPNLIVLHRGWLVGEAVAVAVALVPGLLLARWTIERRNLNARTLMQMAIFSVWVLVLIPTMTLRLRPSSDEPLWFVLPVLMPFALVAASAVHEFNRRGRGTPLPYDPPERLVTSGPYAYVANPMQLAMTVILLGLSVVFRSWYLALGALVAAAYGSGLAEWHQRVTMTDRFGDGWDAYRATVRNWIPRRRPYVAEPSVVYVAGTCDMCSGVGGWLARRNPVGLRIEGAETLEAPPRRMMYVPSDGSPADYGVAAFGRALEHINVAWALLGFALRLPVLRALIQVLVDASGGGPRTICSDACQVSTSLSSSSVRIVGSADSELPSRSINTASNPAARAPSTSTS